MSRQYILTIDQGTSSTRALLVSKRGAALASAQKPLPTFYPKPGYVEQDARAMYQNVVELIDEVVQRASIYVHDILSIGITNQRESVVVWERKSGKPIHNAIIWQDRRTSERCAELAKHASAIHEKTGLLLDPYFSATKLEWILSQTNEDVLVGTIDSYLVWMLSGGKLHITDYTNASRTMLFNIHTKSWDDDLLKLFSIPKSVLPEVHPSSMIYGTSTSGIPIAGIAGDQQAALFGQGCFNKGDAKITFGTGCFALINTGKVPHTSAGHLLTTLTASPKEPNYALEGSVLVGGAAISWLTEKLGVIKNVKDVEKLASSVPDTHGLCFVPALTGLGAPHWKPHAQGMIMGITRGTSSAHLARATLEGIAHLVADVVEAMEVPLKRVKVDGGAIENTLLMQMQANFLGMPLLLPKQKELSALGSAYLAGLASGFWSGEKELLSLWKKAKEYAPKMSSASRHKEKARWEKALSLAASWGE